MNKYIFSFVALLYTGSMFSQANDHTWYLGYSDGPSKVTFTDGRFSVFSDTSFMGRFFDNNAVISDSSGNYLAAFNGIRIYDSEGKIMMNGDSIRNDTLPYLYGYADDDLPQGSLFLPWPNHPDSLLLLYNSQGNAAWPDSSDLASLNLFYAVIQKSGNNGRGGVVQRRGTVLNDSIQYGRLTAVKHANGRDWWILVNERYSNRFYRILFDPSGIHVLGTQMVPLSIIDGMGQAAFSPDGHFYAVKNSVGIHIGNSIDIFRFDRCSGYLTAQYQKHWDGSSRGGVAFSNNSRYLYVSHRLELFQYDLWSDNLDSSRVLVGVYEPVPGFSPTFYTMQLAPDQKIYMCSTNGQKTLHVIHHPDRPGADCGFQQRGIQLPVYNFASLSYSPNFRLGPMDNSPCDSLGLNNMPKAWFRTENDTNALQNFVFTDLSYYEPDSWYWDFGDGQTSTERNPVHTYDSLGVYQACLTVSNINGSDTFCRTLYIGVSSVYDPGAQVSFGAFPNPFRDILAFNLETALSKPKIRLYNQYGQLMVDESLESGVNKISSEKLPGGIYLWVLVSEGRSIKGGKVVKIE